MYLYANAGKCEFSYCKMTPLSLHSELGSPEATTEQGSDVCCRVEEPKRKFPVQIQKVIDDTGKAAELYALELIEAHGSGLHKWSLPQQLAVWLLSEAPCFPFCGLYCT